MSTTQHERQADMLCVAISEAELTDGDAARLMQAVLERMAQLAIERAVRNSFAHGSAGDMNEAIERSVRACM